MSAASLADAAGLYEKDCYVEAIPFASSSTTALHWVRKRSNNVSLDLKVGFLVARPSNNTAVFVPFEEFPVLSDVLAGIVRRAKLT